MTPYLFESVIPLRPYNPPPVTKIPVTHLWEVAALAKQGFRVKINGNRAWMVKP